MLLGGGEALGGNIQNRKEKCKLNLRNIRIERRLGEEDEDVVGRRQINEIFRFNGRLRRRHKT